MDQTLRYLLLIRLIVIGGQCFALLVMDAVFGVAVPWTAVSVVLVALAVFTLSSWGTVEPGQRQYLAQSIADIAGLSALVYVTGGAFNPFITLFLLPIVFAAAAMTPLYLAGITLLAAVCYTLLMFVERPVQHVHAAVGGFDLHVWGMWYGFMLSAACVALLVARISRRLRTRDQEIAIAREELLKSERLLALGTLAAGTAHELGTPLSSMAVIAGELEALSSGGEAQDYVQRLHTQIARCKAVLARMAHDAGAQQAGEGEAIAVDAYLDGIVTEWRRRRPEVHVDYRRTEGVAGPAFVADRVITQAIVNVLDNAAEASVRAIEVRGEWTAERLEIEVCDDGAGIPADINARLGREAVSTKAGGMGIGLLLARSVLERLGGTLEFSRGTERGTRAHLVIPLAPLRTA
ncbi:MAG: ATP-binding protein [Gammaproteobacteria bacterium]